ncbi:MAG TPA: FixH family protein [Pseudomonadales bacterium]
MVRPTTPRLLSAALLWLAAAAAAAGGPWTSESGAFRLGYQSRLQPLAINRMHAWVLHLERADGAPVEGAEVTVSGGMPAHDHGLPTAPRVTRELGGGDYLLEGVRFHMNGDWELRFEIDVGGTRDVVIVPLRL